MNVFLAGRTIAVYAVVAYLLGGTPVIADVPGKPGTPDTSDKCPVCGMFVYKYPDWVSQVHFQGGSVLYFDGPKDMFKFMQHPGTYSPDLHAENISTVLVTEYYDLALISAFDAWFVIGSDVYGPMGKELIPFARKQDAEAFMKDHKAKAILTFDQVTPRIIDELE